MIYEKQLEYLKKKLYRLHFLLTESESDVNIRESVKHFLVCFKDTMFELSNFLLTEYAQKPENNKNIIELSFKHKLFNKSMIEQLELMLLDFEKLESGESTNQIYNNIKESYAGNLQMIYDMLSRMGQDAEEE